MPDCWIVAINKFDRGFGEYNCRIQPKNDVDIGLGKGKDFIGKIIGGEVGIVLDGRGRGINFNDNENERVNQILDWSNATNEY